MKKNIIFILCFIVSTPAFSQLSLGVKTGMARTSLNYIDKDTKPGVGYKAGITAEYMFSKWGINSGILISQNGISYSDGVLANKNDGIHRVSMWVSPRYIQIPISAVYKFSIDDHVKMTVNAGIYFSKGIAGKGLIRYDNGSIGFSVFDDTYITNSQDFSDFMIPKANPFDSGVILGLGFEVYKFNFSMNYEEGATNVYDQFPVSPTSKDVKNRVFWLGIGYNFNL